MANGFTKQELVMFDKMVAGFDDMLVAAKTAETYPLFGGESAERSGDRFWVPQPLIGASYDGFDQTSNFAEGEELSVPVSIGYHKSSPIKLTSKNLRNETYLANRAKAAKQKLASDINLAVYNTVALQGANVSAVSSAPTGFDDIALADAMLTEKGVPIGDRHYLAAPRVANKMAGNLASRQTFSGDVKDAYQRATIGIDIAGFDVHKNDQSIRLAAATGGATTVNGASQYTEPAATTTAATGESENKDNRYTDLAITATTYANIKVGDAFTIEDVNSVHMITKQDTGQLQTFRVVGKPAAGTIRVYPAIIPVSGGSGGTAEKEYANVTAAPATGAALTWLNIAAAELNPFFKRESLILVPGDFAVDPEDGWLVQRATTDLGVNLTYTRQGEINDLSVKARWDVDFGTALLNPEMAGVQLFNQV